MKCKCSHEKGRKHKYVSNGYVNQLDGGILSQGMFIKSSGHALLTCNNSVNYTSKAKKKETYCKACTSQFLILIKHLLDFFAKLIVLNLKTGICL